MKKVFLQWAHQDRVLDVALHWPGCGCKLCAGERSGPGVCSEVSHQDHLLPLSQFLHKHQAIAAFVDAHQGGNGEVWLTKVWEYLHHHNAAATAC